MKIVPGGGACSEDDPALRRDRRRRWLGWSARLPQWPSAHLQEERSRQKEQLCKGPGVETDLEWVQRWPVWSLERSKHRAGRWKKEAGRSH